MTDHRASAVSFSSNMADELDRIQVQEHYELSSFSKTPELIPLPFQHTEDQKEEQLLNVQGTRLDDSKLIKAEQFMHTGTPSTPAGRSQIRKDIARAGPVTRCNSDPHKIKTDGFRGRWRLEGWRFGDSSPSLQSFFAFWLRSSCSSVPLR